MLTNIFVWEPFLCLRRPLIGLLRRTSRDLKVYSKHAKPLDKLPYKRRAWHGL